MKPVTEEEVHDFLNKLLDCDERGFTQLALERFVEGTRIHVANDNLLKWLRRRVVRRTEYIPPKEPGIRLRRDGSLWTWTEEKVMKFAFRGTDSETPAGVIVTNEYIADFLQRPVSEVMRKRNTKFGIQGFDL